MLRWLARSQALEQLCKFKGAAHGLLADAALVQPHNAVGVACFAYLAFYAIAATRTLRNQGIDLDKLAAGSGH